MSRAPSSQINITQVPIADLRPAVYNPRQWSDTAKEKLKESIRKFGAVDPLIVNAAAKRRGIVIGGHFRLECMKELGFKSVPVVFVNIPGIDREKELNIRLNRNQGAWDFGKLKEFDMGLLLDVGFEDSELSHIWDDALSVEEDDFDVEGELRKIKQAKTKAGDLSKFVVTVVDRYFLLDKSLREIESWQVPYKIDTNDPSYQRRSTSRDSGADGELLSALQTLGIEQDHPTADDVKQAFRSMTKQYHPDKNKDEDAENRMKAILNAYDYIREHGLDGIDAQELEDDYWMKIVSRQTFNAGGLQMTVEMGISVDPSDWIYATGMSQNGERVYLGCYSGKVYEVSQGGVAHTLYVVPNAEPIREILENGVFLYILTHSHLYIIDRESHSFLRSIQIHDNQRGTGYIKFGEDGFVHVLNYSIRAHATDGTELWSMTFESAPKYVCLTTDNRYVVETGKKLYLLHRL